MATTFQDGMYHSQISDINANGQSHYVKSIVKNGFTDLRALMFDAVQLMLSNGYRIDDYNQEFYDPMVSNDYHWVMRPANLSTDIGYNASEQLGQSWRLRITVSVYTISIQAATYLQIGNEYQDIENNKRHYPSGNLGEDPALVAPIPASFADPEGYNQLLFVDMREYMNSFEAYPVSYFMAITDKGLSFAVFSEDGQHGGAVTDLYEHPHNQSWFVIQRPVDQATGEILFETGDYTSSKNPVCCLYGIQNSAMRESFEIDVHDDDPIMPRALFYNRNYLPKTSTGDYREIGTVVSPWGIKQRFGAFLNAEGGVGTIKLSSQGAGYDQYNPPTISVVGGMPDGSNPTDAATVQPVILHGRIVDITITHAGSGYVLAPRIEIDPPPPQRPVYLPKGQSYIATAEPRDSDHIPPLNKGYCIDLPDYMAPVATGAWGAGKVVPLDTNFDTGVRFYWLVKPTFTNKDKYQIKVTGATAVSLTDGQGRTLAGTYEAETGKFEFKAETVNASALQLEGEFRGVLTNNFEEPTVWGVKDDVWEFEVGAGFDVGQNMPTALLQGSSFFGAYSSTILKNTFLAADFKTRSACERYGFKWHYDPQLEIIPERVRVKPLNGVIQKFIVREADILRPTTPEDATSNSDRRSAWINDRQQLTRIEHRPDSDTVNAGSFVLAGAKYVLLFPSRITTPRFRYSHDLDMIAYTSSDVLAPQLSVSINVYNEGVKDGNGDLETPHYRRYFALHPCGVDLKTTVLMLAEIGDESTN